MIDKNKPLRFVDKRDTREIILVGVMPNGDIVATSNYGDGRPWETPSVFDKTTGVGPLGLTIVNAPVVSSGFYPLDADARPCNARGMTTLSGAMSDYLPFRYFLEVVYSDGKPTEVKLHDRNDYPNRA